MEKYFKNRIEWRRWLEKNSTSAEEIWMIIYKKHTKKPCVSYNEAVEEALCFGWIDGKIKRINDEYFIQRYTPRKSGSRWSKYNIERVKRMIDKGRMKPQGMVAYNEIFEKPDLVYENRSSGDPVIPDDLLSALENNTTAYNNFVSFPPSARRLYIEWLNSAKREETRPGRIVKIVLAAEQNKKPGMI
jgi:uncharacterized protein YdeI (YjbR/CyaY-like superfamily)